jgi:hypothetical protein
MGTAINIVSSGCAVDNDHAITRIGIPLGVFILLCFASATAAGISVTMLTSVVVVISISVVTAMTPELGIAAGGPPLLCGSRAG